MRPKALGNTLTRNILSCSNRSMRRIFSFWYQTVTCQQHTQCLVVSYCSFKNLILCMNLSGTGRILINGMKESGYEVYGHDIDGAVLTEMDVALTEIRAHARSKFPILILNQFSLHYIGTIAIDPLQ